MVNVKGHTAAEIMIKQDNSFTSLNYHKHFRKNKLPQCLLGSFSSVDFFLFLENNSGMLSAFQIVWSQIRTDMSVLIWV